MGSEDLRASKVHFPVFSFPKVKGRKKLSSLDDYRSQRRNFSTPQTWNIYRVLCLFENKLQSYSDVVVDTANKNFPPRLMINENVLLLAGDKNSHQFRFQGEEWGEIPKNQHLPKIHNVRCKWIFPFKSAAAAEET